MLARCPNGCLVAAADPAAAPPSTSASLLNLFDTTGFPARWYCGRWSSALGWLHILSDLAIFAAYLSIPVALAWFLIRRRDVPFPRLITLYGAFILSCGIGHAVEALIFWHPVYRLAGVIKAITALVSWATVIATIRIMPAALHLPNIARSEKALRASEERFALAARGTDQGIWDWDLVSGSTYYSPRFLELLGYQAGDPGFTTAPWQTYVHPDDLDLATRSIIAHFEQRISLNVEFRLRTREGGYRWFHCRGQAVWDVRNEPTRMVGSITDITDRKQHEAEVANQVRLAEFGRDIALVLTADLGLAAMLDRCVELTAGRLGGSAAAIWTLDETGLFLEPQANATTSAFQIGFDAPVLMGAGLIGQIAGDRKPVVTDSTQRPTLAADLGWEAGNSTIAFVGYPLIVGDRLIGLWVMVSASVFHVAMLAAAERVAHDIALAIERNQSAVALLRSETEARKLALVAARTHNAVILTDPAGRIEWVNLGFTRITGYELAEVIGKSPGSILQGRGTDPHAIRQMREWQSRGEGFKTEILNYAKDGREYWISIEVQPIHDDAGRLVHFMAIEADITERKRAEAALWRSEERFALALRGTNEGVWDWDMSSDIVSYSPRVAELLGREPRAFEGVALTWRSLIHPDDVERGLAILAEHLEHRKTYDVEFRLRVDDGSYRWFHCRGLAIWDETGRPVRMVGSIGDISSRKETEQQLRLLQAAVEHANDVILITEAEPIDSPGPRVVYVNTAFERITGYTSAEIIGQTPRILHGPRTDRATLDNLRADLWQWRPIQVELLNYTKAGREFWVELNIHPVAGAGGSYTHWVSVQRDITERKLADLERRTRSESQVRDLNFQLEQRIHRLDALRQIDLAISGSLDLRLTLGIVLDQVRAQIRVDAAAILLINKHDQTLAHAASKGFRTDRIAASRLRFGEGYATRAVLGAGPVSIPNLLDVESPFLRSHLLVGEDFVSYLAIPLVSKGLARGVIEIYHRSSLQLSHDSMAFFEALADQAAIAIDNATLFSELQSSHMSLVATYDATIEGWARALDLRDKETEGHTRRVTEMTVELARSMGISDSEMLSIRRGALLHDIGKLGIPDAILLKPGKLTAAEWEIMRRHPSYAFEWLAPIETLRPALDIPYAHHEKWDGSGYPRGLKGNGIPLSARIFAVVDIWDALRSDRPYRAGWPEDRVLDHIQSLAGNHLEPAVVDAFLRLRRTKERGCACQIGHGDRRGEAVAPSVPAALGWVSR